MPNIYRLDLNADELAFIVTSIAHTQACLEQDVEDALKFHKILNVLMLVCPGIDHRALLRRADTLLKAHNAKVQEAST